MCILKTPSLRLLLPPSCTHRQLTEEQRRHSLEEESVWLKLRSLTLRLLACLASLEHSPSLTNSDTATENGDGDKTSTLGSLLAQLQHTLQAATQIAEKRIQVCSASIYSVWDIVVSAVLKQTRKKKSLALVLSLISDTISSSKPKPLFGHLGTFCNIIFFLFFFF